MRKIRIAFFVSVFLLVFSNLFAEEITDPEFGYSLDIPEGFSVSEYTPDGMSYLFVHQNAPVSFLLKIYGSDKISSASEGFSFSMKRLNAKFSIDEIEWMNVPCAIGQFEMTLPNADEKSKGWGTSLTLPGKNAFLVLLCYTNEKDFEGWQNFIISSINSVCIDTESEESPGIITSYAFPKTQSENVSLNVEGFLIETKIDKDDVEASRFVRDLEYSVLLLYQGHPKWKEAWIRYYRMIFRDSCGRLKNASLDIYSSLKSYAEKENPENPYVFVNETLLSWVQNMSYERNVESERSSDFTDLISTMKGEGSDCDSRSLLMCALLKNMGAETCLFVSREYSHALYGVLLDIPGAKINVDGKNFLLCETTAKNVKPGLVAQSQSDSSKWIPVSFR